MDALMDTLIDSQSEKQYWSEKANQPFNAYKTLQQQKQCIYSIHITHSLCGIMFF